MNTKYWLNKLTFLSCLLIISLSSKAQVAVNTGVTVNDLVTAISGPGVIITNPTLNCPNGAFGTFSGGGGNLGITDGIILTTGDASLAAGPNVLGSSGFCSGTSASDPDLTAVEPQATEDVCTLEFDVIPQCDILTLDYVFGSEEYPEFVGGSFNDAFGFFLTGPNPGGGNYNSQNVALLPGTSTPVSIDNVNSGSNAGYYIDNTGGTATEYDGLTTGLTATMPVVQCATYHMKLIIADAGDCSYDSGVFLDFEGLTCPNSDASLNPIVVQAAEGCIDASFEIIADFAVATTVYITTTGTATNGADFSTPGSYNLPAGPSTTGVTIAAVADGLVEGTETMNVILSYDVCGTMVYDTLPMTILDQPTINFTSTDENCGACDGSASATFNNAALPIASYTWTPAPGGGQGTANVTGLCAGTYILEITDANGCPATDSVVIGSIACACSFTSIADSLGFCDGATNLFPRYGTVEFDNPPATGLLIFTDCMGNADTLYPPFTSPASYYMEPNSDGTTNCDITAVFTADPACTISIAQDYPAACGCVADVGTFTGNVDGTVTTEYVLCYGETFTMTSDGNMVPPDEATNPPITDSDPSAGYNPGIGYLIYSCPPTVFPQDPITTDPCLLGVVGFGDSFSDANVLGGPTYAGSFTDNTIYYVPITFYDTIAGYYSYTNTTTNCYSMGTPFAVQYLPEVVSSNPTENCQDSTFTITINGGLPELDGSNFTATNLQPATAFFVNNTTGNGGTIQIGGLLNGDMYSFDVADTNGCPITISGGPFVGLPYANAGVDDSTCTLTYAMNPTPSFGTGTWTGPGNISFTPNANTPGATATSTIPGTFTLTWTEDNGGGCTSTDNVDITFSNLSYTATTTPATCGNADGGIIITAQDGITAYTYSIDNGATFQASNTFTGLTSGPYNIVVQDAIGCQVTGIENVGNFGAPTIDQFVITQPLCNNDCNGQVSVLASGGTTPYQYSLNGGAFQASNVFNGLCGDVALVFTIRDSVGCEVTGDTILINPNLLVIDSITHTDVDCYGNSTGTIEMYSAGGTGTLSYSIDNGASYGASSTFTGLTAGTYYVWVRDANNCTVNDSVVITEPQPLSIPNTVDSVVCFGQANGQVLVTPQGGTTPYTYAWSSSSNTTNNETGLVAGSVTVTVTDDNQCTLDSTFTIYEPAQFTYTTDSQNSNCNQPDGWAAVVGFAGGTGTYTYQWDANAANQVTDTAFNLVPGNYDVTITDGNLCDTTLTITVGNTPSVILDSLSTTDPLCNNDCNGEIVVFASGGSGTLQYSINSGALQASGTFTGLCGATPYLLTVEDSVGCIDTMSTILIDPTLLVMDSIVTTNVTCNGFNDGTITVYATGGSGTLNYSIDNGNTYGATPDFVNLAPGTYYVWVQDANNCTVNDSVVITEPQPLSIPNLVDSVVCFGTATGAVQTLPQGGTSPYTYAWSSSSNTTNNETNLLAGNVTVTVTDDNQCTLDSTFIIYEPAQFTYTTDAQNANCYQPDGWAAVVGFAGGTGAYTYQWDANAANQVTDTAYNLVPGDYDVTITDENLCDTTLTITVGNNPSFTTSITGVVDATCYGGSDGEATVNGSDPTATYLYAWDANTGNQTTSTATGLSVGTYYVTVTDSVTGCMENDSVTIAEPTPVTINSVSPDVTICSGQTTNITATAIGGSGTGYVYTWDNGLGDGQTQTVGPAPGTVTVYNVTAVDDNNCPSDVGTVTVTVNPDLSVLMSNDDTICPGASINISALASLGNGGPYTYSWSPNSAINNTSDPNPIVNPTEPTTYYVTINDGCSPSIIDSVTISIYNLPIPLATADTLSLCEEPVVPVTFYNLTDTSNGMLDTLSVIWDFGDGITSNNPNTWDTIQHVYTSPGTYTVSMTVSSMTINGGCTVTDVVVPEVIIHPLPTPDFTSFPNPTTMFEPEVDFVDLTPGNITEYLWDFAAMDSSTFQNPSYEFPDDTSGTYLVTLTVTDMYQCVNSITKAVIVKGEFGLYVPNTFTPDGDNKNDIFTPKGFGIIDEGYSFMIFDRWGEKIFETHDWGTGWDGYYKGTMVKEDTYVWKIVYKDVNGEKHDKYGHVNVIK